MPFVEIRLQWGTAIASHADIGQQVLSKLSRSEVRMHFTITQGAENIGTYNKTQQSSHKWCKSCGGHLLTEHPEAGVTDVYAAILSGLPFQPGAHVQCQETVLRVKDGLEKMKDLPKEMGGSGEALSE